MVETPLRRSRRIQSQSDDEASVASSTRSGGSRTRSSTKASGTPTRRSTRSSARVAAKSTAAEKTELEAIPETITTDGDGEAIKSVEPTPAKSARKKKATKAAPATEEKAKESKEECLESMGEGAPTPAKSAKKKTPAKSAKKSKKSSNADESKAEDEAPASAKSAEKKTPSRSAKKKKAKTPVKEDTNETTNETQQNNEGESNGEESNPDPTTTSPPKSSKKKRKNRKSLEAEPVKSPPEEDVNEDSAPAPATPSTSAKKKRKKKTPATDESQDEGKQNMAAPTKDDSEPAAVITRERKKRTKVKAPKPVEQPAPADSSAEAKSDKKKKKRSSRKKKKKAEAAEEGAPDTAGKSIDVDVVIGEDVVVSEVPVASKSDKKKKKKEKKREPAPVEVADEVADVATEPDKKEKKKRKAESQDDVPEPKGETSEPAKKKKRKRRDKSTDATAVSEDTSETKTTNDATEPAKKSKNKKKRDKQGDGEQPAEESSAPTPGELESEPTLVTSAKPKKKNKDKEVKDATNNSDANRTGKNAKKRKRAMSGASDSIADESPDNATSSKSQAATPTSKSPQKEETKKTEVKTKPRKHDKPTISPSPKARQPKFQQVQSQPTESPKLMINTKVHRVRFLKLHPKSILAMASAPTSSTDQQGLCAPARLAVAREGGSVELLSPQDRWVSVGDVPGVRGREVDALVWVSGNEGTDDKSGLGATSSLQDLHTNERRADEQRRLFGCSRDGTIFELDFARKRQKGVIGSGGGGVFCLASCAGCDGYFAAGCEDGSIKIYSVIGSDGEETLSGSPQLVATLPSAGNAVLSLAWVSGQSSDSNEGGMGGSVIFAGVADGTIRRFDCSTSVTTGPISTGSVLASSRGSTSVSYRWKSTLRMTVENQGLRESTKVWALQALSDGTVISGDSLGHVQIWDGTSGTMTQTFDHNESGADVLCLAVSEDENKIFASGIDSSVRCYQRQCLPNAEKSSTALESTPMRKWISSNSHRKHSHDVKALAICHKETGNKAKPLELLVSGGVDTRICTYITKDFKSSRPKIWYNWPLSPVTMSRKQRILAVTRENSIDLYQLGGNGIGLRDESKCLIKTISIQSPFNLSCSAISDDGKFLAASDAVSLYVFSLETVDDDGILDVRPSQLGIPAECKQPATALKFGETGRLVCATNNGQINVLQASHEDVRLKHVFREHVEDWSASSHHFPVICLDLSSDGKWLAAGRFSAGKGAVHVFTLPTNEDGRYQHWWSVPKMDATTTCVKFLGGGGIESSLAVGCSSNEFYIYNLGRRSLSHWSNDMGLPPLKSLPKELTSRSEPVARIVANPAGPQKLILGSHGYFCAVDLDQPVPERARMVPENHLRAQRLELAKEDDANVHSRPPRKKLKNNGINNFTVCLQYCEIQFQDFIGEDEMVVVEQPWMSILEELPDALERRAYGT